MYKFFQRNQKKLLAVFGVLLMIVFILPTQFKGSGSRGDMLIGKAGGTKIYGSDEAQAKKDLQDLRQASFQPLGRLGNGAALAQFPERPLLYVLLQREAERDGVQVSEQAIQDALKQASPTPEQQEQLRPAVERFLLVQAAYERAASSVKVTTPVVHYALARHDPTVSRASGVQGLRLNVVDLSPDQFLDKVPAPTPEQIRHHYEQYADRNPTATSPGYRQPSRFKVQYIQLPAEAVVESFLKTLETGPASYQLDIAAYNYYQTHTGDFQTPPEPAPTTNPTTNPTTTPTTGPATGPTTGTGAGLAIGPSTQPATGPTTAPAALAAAATGPATGPASRPAVAKTPTTRPFEEVKVDVRRRLLLGTAVSDSKIVKDLRPKFDAYVKGLRDELRNRMEADYLAYAVRTGADAGSPTTSPATAPATQPASNPAAPAVAAGPTTGPTTVPSAGLAIAPGVPYDSYEYLEALATAFQQRHGIRPLPASLANKWWTAQELIRPSLEDAKALGPINQATANGLPFGYVVTQLNVELTTRPSSTTAPAAFPTSGPAAATPATGPATTQPAATGPATSVALAPTTAPATSPSTAPAVERVESVKLFKPSEVLQDLDDNAFVFRISAFDPAHAPTLAEVEPTIVKDLKAAAATEMVKAEAAKLLSLTQAMNEGGKNAKTATTGALVSAARTERLEPLEVGPVASPERAPADIAMLQARGQQVMNLMQRDPNNSRFYINEYLRIQQELQRLVTIDGFAAFNKWSPPARFEFLRQVATLAQKATPADPHPAMVIDLPTLHHQVVAEAAKFEFDWPADQADREQLLIAHRFAAEMEAKFAEDWFNFDNVAKRAGYEPADKDKKSDSSL